MARPRVPPVEQSCEGCGATFLAFKRDRRRFCGKSCSGRANAPRLTGALNNRYNGGLCEHDGRLWVVCRDGSQVTYARALMMGHLGRLLGPWECVHHVNEDPADDRLENLMVMSRAEHARHHMMGKRQ